MAPPDAPADVKVVNTSSAGLSLSWTAPSCNGAPIFEYRVELSDGLVGEDFKLVATEAGTTTDVRGLQPAAAYRVRVFVSDPADYIVDNLILLYNNIILSASICSIHLMPPGRE